VALNNFQMLVDGGTAGMFWSYTWVIVGQFFIGLELGRNVVDGSYRWRVCTEQPTSGFQTDRANRPISLG